MNTRGWRKY